MYNNLRLTTIFFSHGKLMVVICGGLVFGGYYNISRQVCIYIVIIANLQMSLSIKPMKVEVYNAIVEDFKKFPSFSRKSENEMKKKFKKWVVLSVTADLYFQQALFSSIYALNRLYCKIHCGYSTYLMFFSVYQHQP